MVLIINRRASFDSVEPDHFVSSRSLRTSGWAYIMTFQLYRPSFIPHFTLPHTFKTVSRPHYVKHRFGFGFGQLSVLG
jgi:hypothetical protein